MVCNCKLIKKTKCDKVCYIGWRSQNKEEGVPWKDESRRGLELPVWAGKEKSAKAKPRMKRHAERRGCE